jgi:hypothetical protein
MRIFAKLPRCIWERSGFGVGESKDALVETDQGEFLLSALAPPFVEKFPHDVLLEEHGRLTMLELLQAATKRSCTAAVWVPALLTGGIALESGTLTATSCSSLMRGTSR